MAQIRISSQRRVSRPTRFILGAVREETGPGLYRLMKRLIVPRCSAPSGSCQVAVAAAAALEAMPPSHPPCFLLFAVIAFPPQPLHFTTCGGNVSKLCEMTPLRLRLKWGGVFGGGGLCVCGGGVLLLLLVYFCKRRALILTSIITACCSD